MGAKNVLRLWSAALKSGEVIDFESGDVLKLLPNTDNQGSIEIGDGSTDLDVKVFLGETTDFVIFDVSAGHVVFDNAELNMGDSDEIEFGDGQDIVVQWNGSYMEAAPRTGMWANCPSALDPTPGLYSEFFDDFLSLSDGAAAAVGHGVWNLDVAATGGTALMGDADTANTPGNGGYVALATLTTDNDFAYYSVGSAAAGSGFLFAASGLKTWFEIQFVVDSVTTSVYYMGMFGGDVIKPFADDTGDETVTDGIYWRALNDAPTEIDFCINQGGTESIIAANADTLVIDTVHKLGFYTDGTTLTPYYDGVAGTATTHAATNFPTDAGLTPGFGVLSSATSNVCTIFVDYVKVVQMRS